LNIKIGYYPLFDMVLALRQFFSVERFKPYNDSMLTAEDKLTENDINFIQTIGNETRGWLKVLAHMTELHVNGLTNAEELLLKLLKTPELIFSDMASPDIKTSDHLLKLWQEIFSLEIAKHSKLLFDKTLEINNTVDDIGVIQYITQISDRVKLIDDKTLKFMIKPDHEEQLCNISNIIIMPSHFAVRDLTFWHNGTDYIFFISTKASSDKTLEPSDNLLLKTMAFNDKTRLKMLRLLSLGHYSSSEMAEKLDVNPSTVSRHFKLFKDAGFVEIFSQEGNTVYYTLNNSEIKDSLNMVYNFIDE